MLRSLWSAASGMMAQQTNLDTISNNIANINTTGFKTQSMEFKSLLYQQLKTKSTDSEGNPKPIGVQVGLGVRNASITAKFTQGAALDTGEMLDLFIQGNGFFAVKVGEKTAYTRNGHMVLSSVADGWELTTSDGNPILSTKGTPIKIDSKWDPKDISIDLSGNVLHRVDDKEAGTTKYDNLGKIALYQFNNPAGLNRSGGSLYYATPASGEARSEDTDAGLNKSLIKSGYLEGSNVSAADEMVNMIVTQRAYQLNSKAITASDEMLEQANNLRR